MSLLARLALATLAATTGLAHADVAEPRPAAVRIAGVEFSPHQRFGEVDLELRTVGLLRWLVFDGYAAALYLPRGAAPDTALDDVPKRLELHYFRSVPAEAFGDAAQQILERNVAPARLVALQERVDRIAALYVDVEPGDRYALSYAPGRGTVLEHNGNPVGSIAGADFATAYFAIWLGAEPIDERLRDQLLSAS